MSLCNSPARFTFAPLLSIALCAAFLAAPPQPVAADSLANMPFAPAEAEVMRRLIDREGVEVVVSDTGVPRVVVDALNAHNTDGYDLSNLKAWRAAKHDNDRSLIIATYDENGHILAFSGNGPWIHNESLREFVHLPELRAIFMPHNSRHHQEPERGDDYTAVGFDALADSKIHTVALTSGLDDAGLAAILKLNNLQNLSLFHTRVSPDGIALLRNHPTITHLRIGQMGRLPASVLETVATIPNLTHLRFNEAFVTYHNGLDHLQPLAGQLQQLDLRMSLITEADLAKVRADHPQLEITPSTPDEVVAGHRGVANRLNNTPMPDELAKPLADALAAQQ